MGGVSRASARVYVLRPHLTRWIASGIGAPQLQKTVFPPQQGSSQRRHALSLSQILLLCHGATHACRCAANRFHGDDCPRPLPWACILVPWRRLCCRRLLCHLLFRSCLPLCGRGIHEQQSRPHGLRTQALCAIAAAVLRCPHTSSPLVAAHMCGREGSHSDGLLCSKRVGCACGHSCWGGGGAQRA